MIACQEDNSQPQCSVCLTSGVSMESSSQKASDGFCCIFWVRSNDYRIKCTYGNTTERCQELDPVFFHCLYHAAFKRTERAASL